MADRILVMKDGYIQQVDTPQALYDRPSNLFVAGFIGAPQMNMFPVTLKRQASGFAAEFEGVMLPLPERLNASRLATYEGRKLTLGLRPEAFHERIPAETDPALTVTLNAGVELAEPMGPEVHLNVILSGYSAIARLSSRCNAIARDTIPLVVDMTMAHLFDPETEGSLME